MLLEAEHPGHHERKHDADERCGHARKRALEDEDQYERADSHHRRGPIDLVEIADEIAEAPEDMITRHGYTGELAELAHEQRDAEPGEVADQRRTREQVGNESEPHHRGDEQHHPDDRGEGGAGGHVVVGADASDGRETGGGERGGARIGSDREMARRPEDTRTGECR